MKRLLFPLALLFVVFTTFSQVSPAEKAALQAFYTALDGPNWTSENDADPNNDWDFSGPVTANWQGLTITSNSVEQINLNQNNLSGSIPPEFSDLIHILFLNLDNNQITALNPNGNPSLWTIDISGNQLTTIDLQNFPQVEFVVANNNQLSSVMLNNVSYVTLSFNNNQLTSFDITNKQIENLYLNNNQLSAIDLSNKTFMDLDLSYNSFTQIDFSNIQSISFFDISHNSLTALTIPDLTDGLFHGFNASHNQISTLTIGMFGSDYTLSNLFSDVDVSYNMLSDHSIVRDFFNYRSIERLDISHNDYRGYLIDTSLLSLNYFHFDNNRYQFGDIIYHQSSSKFIADHSKSPQAKLDLPETRNLPQTTNTTMTTNCTGAYNVYQWYKDGVALNDGANISGSTTDTLTINNLAGPDSGIYHCEVNSTAVTGLTLIRENITLNVLNQPCDVRDRNALIALYNATDGPNWVNSTNWNTAAPLDTWFGVTTNLSGCVVALDMNITNTPGGNNGLDGALPEEIGYLFDLQSIDLSYQNLVGPIPDTIGNLNELIEMDFSNSQLTGAIPSAMGNLNKLQTLLLTNNQLSGSLPNEMGNMTNLRYLFARENILSGNLPPSLGNLTELEVIWLDGNQLIGVIPNSLSNLTKMRQLLLSNNNLTGPIPDFWGSLPLMQVIWLGNNQLTGQIPNSLSLLNNLEQLSLYFNQLTGSIPPSFGNLSSLTHLHMGDNPLSGIIPPELGNINTLIELTIYNTDIAGTLPSEIGNLINLEALWLAYNDISGPIPDSYSNLVNLTELTLSDNHLTGMIPLGFAQFTKMEWLSFSNNHLEGPIPDYSGTPISTFYFQNNSFQFGDFENQFDYYNTNLTVFVDNPQAKVNEIENLNVNIAADITLETAVSGSQNHYQWFKDGIPIAGAPDSPVYQINNADITDAGVYHCEITSAIVTDLTLIRNDITLSVGCTPPTADNPEDVIACESYALPVLSADNYYYTDTNAGGTQLNAGDIITTSQTLYVYTGIVGCSDENTFVITIDIPTEVDLIENVTQCESFMLPILTHGNYFTASGGQGDELFVGHEITDSQTVYIYFESGTCSDESSFEVNIDPLLCEEPTSSCEVQFPKFFTPNGDGANDHFIVLENTCSEDGVLTIYDRLGKLIYQTDVNGKWDGTYNGYRLPATDYWYKFVNTNSNVTQTGHFSLKR